MPDAAGLGEALRPELLKVFKPAFLGRVTMVPYFPLSDSVIRQIIELQLGRIKRRVQDNYKSGFAWTPDLVENIAKRCTEVESGARNVDNILTNTLLPEVSRLLLERIVQGDKPAAIRVGIGQDGSFQYSASTAAPDRPQAEPEPAPALA
jgi:type VI secretion system protein VasG